MLLNIEVKLNFPFLPSTVPEPQGSPPEFIITVQPSKVKEGETAEFNCRVLGDPAPELTWYFNGQVLETTGRYTVVEREELQVLEVYEIKPADAGDYTVAARNPFGEASCQANLTVQGKGS